MTASPPPKPTHSRRGRAAVLNRRLERAGRAFDTGILECLLRREPENVELLAALAESYTRLRRYREGLDLDHRLVRSDPDEPIFRYNLACSLSLMDRLDDAAEQLMVAFELGYADIEHLERDTDLRRLRASPCFERVRVAMQSVARRHEA